MCKGIPVDVLASPEQQLEKMSPKIEGATEANAKLTGAKDASPGTLPTEAGTENEKLRLATAGKEMRGTIEAKINNAHDLHVPFDKLDDNALPKHITFVNVDQLPATPDIRGVNDFRGDELTDKRRTYESMKADLLRHEQMRPLVAQGYGDEAWNTVDQQNGLGNHSPSGHTRGYSDTYRAFYDKSDCIAVDEVNGKFVGIENGRHRIYLAREMGIKQLPVSVLK